MKYVLIVILAAAWSGKSSSVAMHDFDNERACTAAARTVAAGFPTGLNQPYSTLTFCLPKGTP